MSNGPEDVSTSPRPRGGEGEPAEASCQYIGACLVVADWWGLWSLTSLGDVRDVLAVTISSSNCRDK